MKPIPIILISIIIIVAVITVLFFVGQFLFNQLGNVQKYLQTRETKTEKDISEEQIQGKAVIKKPAKLSSSTETEPIPTTSINTYIISGPEQGEIIEDTNKITFEWNGGNSDTTEQISFETKIEGFDQDWVSTSSNKRTITLPAGPKEYKFLVRAKIKNSVDSTPASRNFKINTSPYFEKIEIYSKKYKTSSQPSLITLNSRLDKEEKINITNWRIKGRKGEIIIPQAMEKYQSFGIPGNIFVKQSDRIYLIADSNPIGRDKNFLLNKCFGYYLKYQTFYPSFSRNCPKPSLEEISHLGQYCQEFILDLSRCEIPDPDYYDDFKIVTDSTCISYLNDNFNYSGCFKYHQKDEDFLKNYWYVYVNTDIVSELHDTIELRDQNGLLVDKYIY